MHRGIGAHPEFLNETNAEKHLRDAQFVFLCLDKGKPKALAIAKLTEYGVAFVDVGMGLLVKDSQVSGILRVTTSTREQRGAHRRIPCGDNDAENEYDKNIQVADLNALNATLAVIKWKKLRGYYHDYSKEHFCSYMIEGNRLANEDMA